MMCNVWNWKNSLTDERDKKNIWFEKFENFVKSDRYKKTNFYTKIFNYEFDNGKKFVLRYQRKTIQDKINKHKAGAKSVCV